MAICNRAKYIYTELNKMIEIISKSIYFVLIKLSMSGTTFKIEVTILVSVQDVTTGENICK